MAAWLTTVGELVGAILILLGCIGFGACERVEHSVVPSVLLSFGIVALLGSSAAVAAMGAF